MRASIIHPRKKLRAFTMIEMLIVAIIMGILVVISIPLYKNSVEQSKAAFGLKTLQTLRMLAVDYFNDNDATYAGMTIARLEALGNIATANPEWSFVVTSAGSGDFLITATRLRGPMAGGTDTLTIDQDGNIAGPYPYH